MISIIMTWTNTLAKIISPITTTTQVAGWWPPQPYPTLGVLIPPRFYETPDLTSPPTPSYTIILSINFHINKSHLSQTLVYSPSFSLKVPKLWNLGGGGEVWILRSRKATPLGNIRPPTLTIFWPQVAISTVFWMQCLAFCTLSFALGDIATSVTITAPWIVSSLGQLWRTCLE